jgi:NAD(P)-dependent dehydrogenase (short-subunit alcohol dehydrogenase family)
LSWAGSRRALTIPIDITARDAPDALVERTTKELGGIDVLVNGAGVNLRKPAGAFRREDYDGLMRINVEAAFFISQVVGQLMRQRRWGRIICIGSIAAEVAIPNIALHATSKGALRQMVKSLALEWAKDGVTVNAIAPGRSWTRMTDAVFSDDRLYQSAVRVIPMGRPGIPADPGGRGSAAGVRCRRLHHGAGAGRRWRMAGQRGRGGVAGVSAVVVPPPPEYHDWSRGLVHRRAR